MDRSMQIDYSWQCHRDIDVVVPLPMVKSIVKNLFVILITEINSMITSSGSFAHLL